MAGLQFGESDLFVKEGPTSRSIAVQRRDISGSLEVKVFASTITEYRENYVEMGCNLTLNDLNIQESQLDPAEGKFCSNNIIIRFFRINFCSDTDLKRFEYDVKFDANVREVSIDVEVYDDQLSEKEEYFILSLNYTEHATDRCAIAVGIMDNDRKIENT